jgi:5,10-methylenetetrahydrofolate reductase
MKTKKYDWMIKVTRVNNDNQYVITHINALDSTKEEVIEYAKTLTNCAIVRIYKLETIL